eukprot:1004652-Pelagomonas_calceolata.AAC.1
MESVLNCFQGGGGKVKNTTSSGAFADDLICLVNTFQNLHFQAKKLTLYADWAHLIISGNKTKVTCKPAQQRELTTARQHKYTGFCPALACWKNL